jgi:hypothetical protein
MRNKAAMVETPSAASTFEALEFDEPRDEEPPVSIVPSRDRVDGVCPIQENKK